MLELMLCKLKNLLCEILIYLPYLLPPLICDVHSIVFSQKYFLKWGQQGIVDLKKELEQLLMLISARCLLGKEVREKMLDEVFSTFHDLTDNSLRLTSLLFPYAPLPTTRRRDRARARLSQLFTEVV